MAEFAPLLIGFAICIVIAVVGRAFYYERDDLIPYCDRRTGYLWSYALVAYLLLLWIAVAAISGMPLKTFTIELNGPLDLQFMGEPQDGSGWRKFWDLIRSVVFVALFYLGFVNFVRGVIGMCTDSWRLMFDQRNRANTTAPQLAIKRPMKSDDE